MQKLGVLVILMVGLSQTDDLTLCAKSYRTLGRGGFNTEQMRRHAQK